MEKYKDKIISIALYLAGAFVLTVLCWPFHLSIIQLFTEHSFAFAPMNYIKTHGGYLQGIIACNIDYYNAGYQLEYFSSFAMWLIVLLLLTYYVKSKHPNRRVKDGILGNARLITNKSEIRKKNVVWDGVGDAPEPSLVFGAINGKMVGDPAYAHGWVDAKSGCGKTRSIGYASLFWNVKAGASVIFSARKLTEYKLTHRAIEREGVRCFLLDLEQPRRGARFNLMDVVNEKIARGDIAGAQRAARQLASDFIKDEPKNPYFPEAAKGVLTSCILAVAFDKNCPNAQKHLGSVAKLVRNGLTGTGSDPAAPLKDYIRNLGEDHPAYKAASSFLQDSGSLAAKNVISTLMTSIQVISDEGIEWMLSGSDFTLRQLIERQCVLYPHCMGEGDPYNVILSSFYNQLWLTLQEVANEHGEKLPHPFVILGDEWGNLPKVNSLGEMVSLGRSMDLRVFIFVQNLTQLNKYNMSSGDNSGVDKLLGSMNLQIAMGVMEADPDGKYFSQLAGKTTVLSKNESKNKQDGFVGRGNSGESYNEHQVDLLQPSEFKDRTPLQDGIIVIKGGENGAPKHEGVFNMPVQDATQIPAVKDFFNLGPKEQDLQICKTEEKFLREKASMCSETPICWCPNFSEFETQETQTCDIQEDEAVAWDDI